MHRVWEWDFAQHAKDCQKLAAKTKTRTRKIELLSLAAVWELLAQVRAEQLGRYEPRRDRAGEAA
jgi:PIN domain nuclease of toxin-antitoxin system